PQWVMCELSRDIDRPRPAFQRIKKIREGLPVPGQSVGKDNARNFLDALHQLHQGGPMLRPYWGEADPAITEYRRCDAVPARRRQQRIPHGLSVIVRVRVHPAW